MIPSPWDMAGDAAVNPDAQAAVTDFLDYTEYFPADMIRSLTLIHGLDEKYLHNSSEIHDLTKVYGTLSTYPVSSRPNARQLRLDISQKLDQALNARESAYAEACRLSDQVERHQNRLKSIIAKLHVLPKPPSRDPTPQPQPASSAKRSRSGRKLENGQSTTRLTLKPPKSLSLSLVNRPRHRRVTVPGEVLPAFDPDEPIASTEVSDRESDHAVSPTRPILKLKGPKVPKRSAESSERKPRETVAYRKPTPPPEDAEIGSKHRPWTRLTDYEMYKLRKKMKKNHTWEPSDIMIRRELAEKGRGWDNYYKAKAEAQTKGHKFLDLDAADSPDDSVDKSESTRATTISAPPVPATVKSKPARKAESKKEKEEATPIPNKAALAAQEAEMAARRLGDIGSAFKNLFSPLSNALASLNRSTSSPIISNTVVPKKAVVPKTGKKRKLEEGPASTSPSAEPEGQKKKQKIMPTIPKPPVVTPGDAASADTSKIPLKLNVNPPSSVKSTTATPAPLSRTASAQRTSFVPKQEVSSPVRSSPAPSQSVVASEEPMAAPPRASRRSSVTPAAAGRKTPLHETITPKTMQTAASRRSKRDAPGTVTQSSQDGGAAVSISKRTSKPNKANKATPTSKAAAPAADVPAPEIRIDVDGKQEIVDPDEDRYCVCGDVSWGEMICCEVDDKCEFGVWFHMECVNLVERPPRTVKWFCPGDRKKHHQGENSNGLVGRGIK